MTKQRCKSCNKRIGKRNCPGINGYICTQCCGTKRLKEIRCPDNCQYLQNISFQEFKDYEANKKKWFAEHYQKIFYNRGLFGALIEIERLTVAYDIKRRQLNRFLAYKGFQFLRKSVSPISHLEGNLTDFEDFLKGAIEYLSQDQEIWKNVIPALDYLIQRFEESITDDDKFSEYIVFLKGFFKSSGIEVDKNFKLLDTKEQGKTEKGIILP